MSSSLGKLWTVATPLGNLGDLSPRARETLAAVDFILAEDTRRSGVLLAACGVSAREFVSLHEHNEKNRLEPVLERLRAGERAALIADAGTPLVSDPGYLLVKACRECGIPVSPVPGPSAPMAALAASGLPPLPFAFLGFAPRAPGDIRNFFAPYASLPLTLVFFERKDRLAATLAVARAQLGPREGCIAREMTKTYEEFIPFTLDADLDTVLSRKELLGEITVVLGPPRRETATDETAVREKIAAIQRLAPGARPREVAKLVCREVAGWSVGDIYALVTGEKTEA